VIKKYEIMMTHYKTNESQYARSLIEASLDPLFTISLKGKITDMNSASVNIIGSLRDEILGTDFTGYFTEPKKARKVYQEVFANGSIADSPLTLSKKDGKIINVLFNGSVYRDNAGKVLGAVVVARDTSEQKWAIELRNANKELAYQNDEKEKRADELSIANKELKFQNKEKKNRADELLIADKELVYQTIEKTKREIASIELEKISNSLKMASQYARSLIEASLDPLFTISPKGKITDMNRASVNIIGSLREEILGTDFFGYFTEHQKAREVYLEVFANGSIADSPMSLCKKNGKIINVLFNGSVYRDN